MREITLGKFSVLFVPFFLPHLLSYLVKMFAYIFSGHLEVGDKWFEFRNVTQGLELWGDTFQRVSLGSIYQCFSSLIYKE